MADPEDEKNAAAVPLAAPSDASVPPAAAAPVDEPAVVAATESDGLPGAAAGVGASIATMTGTAAGTSSTGAESLNVPTPLEPVASRTPAPAPTNYGSGAFSAGAFNTAAFNTATYGGPAPPPPHVPPTPLQDVTLEATGTVTDPPRDGVLQPVTLEATGVVTNPAAAPGEEAPRIVEATLTAKGAAQATLDAVIVRAPPSIPEPRSAAISPEWVGGRLAIVAGPARVDLPEQELMAALAAANAELGRVLAELEASPGNVDRRVVEFARGVADAVPTSLPSQFALFVFGQKVDALKRRIDLAVRDGELSADRAAEVQTAVGQLSDWALQFPAWRQFKRNARSAALTNEQVAGAPRVASELADQLENAEAKEFVDESVPNALRGLAEAGFPATRDDPTGMIREGADLLAFDLLESAENVLKRVSSVLLPYLRTAGKGADEEAHKEIDLLARRIVRWAFRGGPFLLLPYTEWFPWLTPLWEYIRSRLTNL